MKQGITKLKKEWDWGKKGKGWWGQLMGIVQEEFDKSFGRSENITYFEELKQVHQRCMMSIMEDMHTRVDILKKEDKLGRIRNVDERMSIAQTKYIIPTQNVSPENIKLSEQEVREMVKNVIVAFSAAHNLINADRPQTKYTPEMYHKYHMLCNSMNQSDAADMVFNEFKGQLPAKASIDGFIRSARKGKNKARN